MTPASYQAWFRLPRCTWQRGPTAPTWSSCWDGLLSLLARLQPVHAEGIVLPAGRHPKE